MNVMDAIQNRREITHYQDKKVPPEDLELIINAGYLAPSGNNLPSKEFVLVTNPNMLIHLSQTTSYVPWLSTATAAIVVLGRPDVSKYWLQDTSIACGFVWLEAVERGVGAAFGAVYHAEDARESTRREEYVRKALGIPHDRCVVAILGLGYPAKEPEAKVLLPRETIVHYESFKG
ncbi:nitroreductase family protein [Mesobacillus maritimus]|uniref:nitroreductase family protein n=1 Tax=Mesobacillus maritimus TaxID=1643336 RepID=UPI00384DE607